MFLFFAVPHASAYAGPEVHTISQYHFNVPPGLESKVNFWKKVYTEYTTEYAIIHDLSDLNVIYEVVYFGDQPSRAAKERLVESVKSRYRNILFKLARGKDTAELTEEEKRVANLVKGGYYRAAGDLRVQLGQKDRFQTGLIRSGQYIGRIKEIFSQHGLPNELTVLPHVESSFQINAYSSAGAAGIWQFTRQTGKLFMKVGNEVDERLDPLQATDAAARLLKKNFELLESWPLAITAYNHGPMGMKRAKSLYGPDIVRINEHYKSRSFGFASQNFYAEFLAALDVVRNQSVFFPNLEMDSPLQMVSMTLNDSVNIHTAMNHFGMTRDEIVKYNPALRSPILSGFRHIPRGYTFRAPMRDYPDNQILYAKSSGQVKVRQATYNHRWYTVKKRDNIAKIAERFSVKLDDLLSANNLGANDSLRTGQKLLIPWPSASSEPATRVVKMDVPGDKIVGENVKTLTYRVEKNDSLYRIAKRFETNPQVLRVMNRIEDPKNLRPGQVLKVPNKREVVPGLVITKKEDHLAIESGNINEQNPAREYEQAKPVEEPMVKKVSLDTAPIPVADKKNRPAFLPVAFTDERQKKSMIGTITVDFDETLSHYAEWADISLPELQRINSVRSTKGLRLRDKVKIPFYRATPEQFEERRREFHKGLQDDFFSNYRVEKTTTRKIGKGETIWGICNNASIPFWLLSLYNQDKNIAALAIDDTIAVPVVVSSKTKES